MFGPDEHDPQKHNRPPNIHKSGGELPQFPLPVENLDNRQIADSSAPPVAPPELTAPPPHSGNRQPNRLGQAAVSGGEESKPKPAEEPEAPPVAAHDTGQILHFILTPSPGSSESKTPPEQTGPPDQARPDEGTTASEAPPPTFAKRREAAQAADEQLGVETPERTEMIANAWDEGISGTLRRHSHFADSAVTGDPGLSVELETPETLIRATSNNELAITPKDGSPVQIYHNQEGQLVREEMAINPEQALPPPGIHPIEIAERATQEILYSDEERLELSPVGPAELEYLLNQLDEAHPRSIRFDDMDDVFRNRAVSPTPVTEGAVYGAEAFDQQIDDLPPRASSAGFVRNEDTILHWTASYEPNIVGVAVPSVHVQMNRPASAATMAELPPEVQGAVAQARKVYERIALQYTVIEGRFRALRTLSITTGQGYTYTSPTQRVLCDDLEVRNLRNFMATWHYDHP